MVSMGDKLGLFKQYLTIFLKFKYPENKKYTFVGVIHFFIKRYVMLQNVITIQFI